MHTRKQYLMELRKEYERAGPLDRGRLLDEAQKRTRPNRKYLIRLLNRRPRSVCGEGRGDGLERMGRRC
jgi:hypothetical protein